MSETLKIASTRNLDVRAPPKELLVVSTYTYIKELNKTGASPNINNIIMRAGMSNDELTKAFKKLYSGSDIPLRQEQPLLA